MIYTSFSLNGAWEMDYSEEKYTSEELPEFKGFRVENAVPGYWEDMTESFQKTPFFRYLRINPEYGIQQYPIYGDCPDMALPNIMGNFFYRRTFVCENIDMPAAIHFGGVMNAVSVWLNGIFLVRHEGYSTPFDVDIPKGVLKNGENTLVLSVSNYRLEGFDGHPVVGLSSRAGCEYSGGITDSIELRVYRCPLRDLAVVITEDMKTAEVRIEAAEPVKFNWSVLDGDIIIKHGSGSGDFSFDTDGLKLWSPESPKLYTLRVECGENILERRFGVRRLTADGVKMRLNGKYCYLRGVCEHFYFPETVNPCHDLKYYRNVIKKFKELGFNYIRFHTYVPAEEYMQAADELGILMHVESPSNTTLEEWRDIVKVCRRHTSTVIYCCGNELQMYDRFIEHLHKCADEVHRNTDSLFSPMSAMRGLEYAFENEPEMMGEVVREPMAHNPRRLKMTEEFCDLYNSYTLGQHSYFSTTCVPERVDSWSELYRKPRLSHEICIDGTYADLSLKDRYRGTRIGKLDRLDSIERDLEAKGLLKNAPLYFKNSCEWQRRVRKYCFESVRRSENIAGYDFLGPIDTHWHTFGYDVGMMNEFYELKPSETVRNVLMYNSATVLLNDLGLKSNFASGDSLNCAVLASSYEGAPIENAELNLRLTIDGKVFDRKRINIDFVEDGKVTKLYDLCIELPAVDDPCEMKLSVTLEGGALYAENEWELYLFPKIDEIDESKLLVVDSIDESELIEALKAGRDVVLFGSEPFAYLSTSFRIALAGRTVGNLATVIGDHPIFEKLPHKGFCSWQFSSLLEGGRAICFKNDEVPFDPIVEVVSTHKNVIRQSALFEFEALSGRLLVCSLNFKDDDPASLWLKKQIIDYAKGESFAPKHYLDEHRLHALISGRVDKGTANTNFAFNLNDKAAISKNK